MLSAHTHDGLRTTAIAPHQVYGPRDPLFLPNLMEAARSGLLRVFGHGHNCISMVHVDNYAHGLILGYHALRAGRAGAEFIIVTDGGPVRFWDAIEDAAIGLGYGSVKKRMHLPVWLLMCVAMLLRMVARITGTGFKLTPFTVKMLTIDRWFDIGKARDVLDYEPIVEFGEGWPDTVAWFKEHKEFMDRCAGRTGDNKVFEKEKKDL